MRFVEEFCKSSDDGKRCRVPTELMQYLPDRYFVYENERYSRVLTLVDEDTIVYGSHDPNKKDEYFIVASKSKRRFLSVLYVNEDGNAAPVEFDQEKVEILDLNGFGERWEGPTLRNSPFGWGNRFDEDGELVYEGFSVFGTYSLYGTEYDPGSHIVLYEGTWCDGRRCGKGESYDRNGSLLCEGEWVNDAPLERKLLITPDNEILHSRIEELVIDDNSGNREDISTVHLSSLPLLNTIQIHNNCFKYVHDVRIENLPALESITIGRHSFKQTDDGFSQRDAQFSCCGNPHLRSIHIGPYSFTEFNSFTVKGTCGMRS